MGEHARGPSVSPDAGDASLVTADHTQTELPGRGVQLARHAVGVASTMRATAASVAPGAEPSGASASGRSESADGVSSIGAGTGGLLSARSLPIDDPERYEAVAEHARGGLGRIIRARDSRLGRTVAIKELHMTSELAESLFVREALITARLEHPGIVPVHEAGRWPSGEPYYVMKMVSGRTLKDLIAERGQLADRLALLPNAIAVAETMAYAHSESVIHRDLKPANIVVGEFGETVVVDWGLARLLDRAERPSDRAERASEPAERGFDRAERASEPAGEARGADDAGEAGGGRGAGEPAGDRADPARDALADTPPQHSVSGKVVGTPAYMAPEQARGGAVDERCDVYALGAVLYELLTGKSPYRGRNPAVVIKRVLTRGPAPVTLYAPEAPPDLIAIVAKAMARDPGDRYPTARELADDLKRFQTGQLVSAHQYSTALLVRRWFRRHAGEVAIAAVALAVLVIVGATSVHHVVAERNEARAAQRTAEDQEQQLLLLQAEASLERDPTAALAWLKRADVTGERFADARELAHEAIARGVASHVLPHGGWAMAAAFSPDGALLATAADDGWIRLWNTRTWELERAYRHGEGVVRLVFSADGQQLAFGGMFGTIGVWDLGGPPSSPPRVRSSVVLDGWVRALEFSRDGRWLYAGAPMGATARWDLSASDTQPVQISHHGERFAYHPADGRSARSLADGTVILTSGEAGGAPVSERRTVLPAGVHRIAITSDGARVLAIDGDRILWAIDWASLERSKLAEGVPRVWWGTSSRSGRYYAQVGEDRMLWLWDFEDGEQERYHVAQQGIYAVAFSPDERLLIAGGDEGIAWLWNRDTGEMQMLRGHTDDIWWVEISDEGRLAVTASLDGDVRVWRLDGASAAPGDERLLGVPTEEMREVVAAGPGQVVTQGFVAGRDAPLRLWDLTTGANEELGAAHIRAYQGTLVTSGDGRRVFASAEHAILGWDLDTRTEFRLAVPEQKPLIVAVSPDGSRVAVPGSNASVLVWTLASGTTRRLSIDDGVAATDVAHGCAFSPDGRRLAVAYEDGVRVWDLAARRVIARAALRDPRWVPGVVAPVTYRPDGRQLALTTSEGVWLWRGGQDQPVVVTPTKHNVVDVAFSPDSRWLAAGRNSRDVLLWPTTGGPMRWKRDHEDMVFSVRFTNDGKHLISTSHDQTVRVLNIEDDTVRILRGHRASVKGLAVLPGTDRIVTSSDDGAIRVWTLADPRVASPAELTRLLDEATSAVIGADHRPVTSVRQPDG